jgi:hypothetical protein
MSGWTSIHRALAAGVALALCAPLAACQTPLERAWGVSQHAHVAQMIDDPEAGLRNREIAHPDGASTGSALQKMRTVEKNTGEAKTESVVNVGGK